MSNSSDGPSLYSVVGHGVSVGLENLEDAYFDFKRYPDLFFKLDKYKEQSLNLIDEMKRKGYVVGREIIDITLDEVCKKEGYSVVW